MYVKRFYVIDIFVEWHRHIFFYLLYLPEDVLSFEWFKVWSTNQQSFHLCLTVQFNNTTFNIPQLPRVLFVIVFVFIFRKAYTRPPIHKDSFGELFKNYFQDFFWRETNFQRTPKRYFPIFQKLFSLKMRTTRKQWVLSNFLLFLS